MPSGSVNGATKDTPDSSSSEFPTPGKTQLALPAPEYKPFFQGAYEVEENEDRNIEMAHTR